MMSKPYLTPVLPESVKILALAEQPTTPASPGMHMTHSVAISIAVNCETPEPKRMLSARCSSAPEALNLMGQRPARRLSARHNMIQRRRQACKMTSDAKSMKSMLDLSSLDFSMAEQQPEVDMPDTPAKVMRVLSTDLDDLEEAPYNGVRPSDLAQALASVRVSDTAPLCELQLGYKQIGDDGVTSIAWAAMQGGLAHLRKLVLTGNRLTRLNALSNALRAGELPNLDVLYLSSNRLNAHAVADLAAATLHDGTSALAGLTQLWLDHNYLGEASSGQAAAAVTPSPSVEALSAIVRACPNAIVLDFSANGLSDAHYDALAGALGCGALGEKLSRAPGPTRLDMSMNNCSLTAIRDLEIACKAHGGVRLVM